jgi:hypothetical protein
MPHTSPPSPAHVLPTFSKVLVGPGTGRARYRGGAHFRLAPDLGESSISLIPAPALVTSSYVTISAMAMDGLGTILWQG